MTTTKENKVLTVSQYEFYKKGDTPMADTAIGKIYGMNPNQLNAFKQENGLIGKYRKKTPWQESGNSALYTGKKVEIQPLREKHIASSSSSVDSKTQTITQAEVIERHNSQNNAQEVSGTLYTDNPKAILVSDLQRLGESLDADLAKRVDLDKFQHEENQEYIAELLEEIADKAEKIEEQKENAKGWERKYYEANGNWESWRSKCMDAERKIEKLKVELEVETSNRKYAEKLMDEALINAQRDEALLAGLAAKFVDVRKRNLEGN